MRIVIPDDYQDAARSLDSFGKLADHHVTVYQDTVKEIDRLAERFHDVQALILIRERTAITEALLARLPKLRFISQTGKGASHIDLDACTRHGVLVAGGGGSPYATAELTWGLILGAMRHIPYEVARLKAGHWQSTLGLDCVVARWASSATAKSAAWLLAMAAPLACGCRSGVEKVRWLALKLMASPPSSARRHCSAKRMC